MLGLHNIFLIAPPPSSFNQIIPNFNDDHYNTTQYSWTNNLKRFHHQESSCPRKEYSLNLDEDHSSSSACKDCGNRAKKECEFRRCRTCCKSKGFGCATHVRSTWVSAARRKEVRRSGDGDGGGGTPGTSSGGGGGKRKLDTTSNSYSTSDNNVDGANGPTCAFNLDASSKFQDSSFKKSLPSQVQAPANFRCIRVAAIDGGEGEVAYQAMVNISGHVFKGFLYNHGINNENTHGIINDNNHSRGQNRDSNSPIFHPASASQRLLKISSRYTQ
ncbi:SHI-related sequence 6 [Euphorbia peplus]|nr:SHI-related sequence 6 [Euphorbia peplus]